MIPARQTRQRTRRTLAMTDHLLVHLARAATWLPARPLARIIQRHDPSPWLRCLIAQGLVEREQRDGRWYYRLVTLPARLNKHVEPMNQPEVQENP